jgi:ParB-like chromosome segregation protein Spo0J
LAGWRRITAAKALGLKEIEVIVREDLVDDPVKQAQVFAQSNLHQELTTLERATLALRWAEDDGVNPSGSIRKVARLLGCYETEVRHLINLAQAPDEVKELVGKKGRGRLGWSTFKSELSGLSSEGMLTRLEEAGDTSRKALVKARRKKADEAAPDRMLETTDYILGVVQQARVALATVSTFLRSASPEARQEIAEAMRPIFELIEEVRDG